MDDVVYGMAFSRPFTNLPAPWFMENMLLVSLRGSGVCALRAHRHDDAVSRLAGHTPHTAS
jgi:hypothetical protein